MLVAFHPAAPTAQRTGVVERLGLAVEGRLPSRHFARVRIPAAAHRRGLDPVQAAAALREDPAVRVAEPDYRLRLEGLPNDPALGQQWGLHNTGQSGGTADADIDAAEAWDLTRGSDDVVVAVIDSGIDYEHPDLAENILRNEAGQVVGYDFGDKDADPMDPDGHGTAVAGVIGARGDNGIGISGVAQRVKLMPVKLFSDEGEAFVSDAIDAIDFAVAQGARVLNASYGNYSFSALELEAIQRAEAAGVLMVTSAGNDRICVDGYQHYPSGYNEHAENVIGVAASTDRDQLSPFSNRGRDTLDLAAPGAAIYTTFPAAQYGTADGTSFAAPHVAGAAALVISRFPGLSVRELKARLLANADRVPGLLGRVATGRLNAAAALREDPLAPGEPHDLRLSGAGETALRLEWVASGEDGTAGQAFRYELRYSTSPITEAGFAAAARARSLPEPSPSGDAEQYLLSDLEPDTAYYVAVRALDSVGAVSPVVTAGPFQTLAPGGTELLRDGAEGKPLFRRSGGWAVSGEQVFRGAAAYSDSPGRPYANRTTATLTQAQPIKLPGAAPELTFYARTDLEEGHDLLYVEVSVNKGRKWLPSLVLTGGRDWTRFRVPLSAYAGKKVLVRFRMKTDGSKVGDGVWLDEIAIAGAREEATLLADGAEKRPFFQGDGSWKPSSGPRFSGRRSYSDSPKGNYRNGVDLALTGRQAIDLEGQAARLSFWLKADLETGYDFLDVEASTDNGQSWYCLRGFTGKHKPGLHTVPLYRFEGRPVLLRFRLMSDDSTVRDGVWLDDIRVLGEPVVSPP